MMWGGMIVVEGDGRTPFMFNIHIRKSSFASHERRARHLGTGFACKIGAVLVSPHHVNGASLMSGIYSLMRDRSVEVTHVSTFNYHSRGSFVGTFTATIIQTASSG